MKEITIPTNTDNDPLKIQLFEILQKIREEQLILRKTIKSMKNGEAERHEVSIVDSPLSLFIHEEKTLKDFLNRLEMCQTSKEWALHAVYPLYEDGYLSAEDAKSKRFIEMTIPYCVNIPKKNYGSLRKQLHQYCYFPK